MIHDSESCRDCFCFVVGDNFYGKRRFRSKILVISIADVVRVGNGCVRGTVGGGGQQQQKFLVCVCVCGRHVGFADKAVSAFCCLLFGVRDLFCQLA